MKTNLSPQLIQDINENAVLLWFEKSNRYLVTSKINSEFIKLYMNPDESRDSFVVNLHQNFDFDENTANTIYNDITIFLKDVNIDEITNATSNIISTIAPTQYIKQSYKFNDKIVSIRYESEVIKSLVHPQISHHSIENTTEFDVLFDIFKTDDNLHLLENGKHVGSFKTQSFHFLQGKFALQLTNTIHNTEIGNWIATFHASTISNGKESIMIVGDSGNGKSTLSVLLMANGFDILCDDFTPLYEDNLNLFRYPAATSIKKGAFKALKPYLKDIDELKTHTSGPKKVNIKYVPPLVNYESQTSSFPCTKIVYVKYNALEKDSITKVSSDKILETLIPDSWISPKKTHALKFINWFKKIDCYQLNYNNNNFAISKFKDLFKES
ncbi:phosphoenolpyruvate carboxykinase (ATP) [Psychroserpens ponticola]|uniref:Serine kinase n=1 Tax=Psychroserpens ponticola TaxID=2932268 RepID=A0ABY7RWD2_9FLAO|nr:hypothetical protein [Psychroserpens ponticola]WCO01153.1 hypothetical protein MUN68_013905 [Psychroserpens ponticola]